jgi:tRNA(Ile2) C34 agmatinyltransferase TiaS
MRRQLASVVVMAVFAGTPAVRAHHSYADFDQDRTVSVGGIIEKISFANPHTVLTLRTKDSTAYTITWAAGRQLSRQGVEANDLKVGDEVIVSGSPNRKAPELSKIREVKRTSDGWTWRSDGGRVSVIVAR